MKPKPDKEPSMTPTRLRELIRSAEDSAADTSQTYAQIETARDTAAALRELLRLRDDAQGAPVAWRRRHPRCNCAKAEREACAKLAEKLGLITDDSGRVRLGDVDCIAATIRAR